MDIVDETLREWRAGEFIWGQSDCMISIGRYLAALGARDVVPRFVGKYADETGALSMMASHGGVSGLVESTGAVSVDGAPQRGDVLELLVGEEGIGALCTGNMVAARLDRGVVEVVLRFVKWRGVWRFG